MTIIAVALFSAATFGALVDIDGNTFTNESILADLDMAAATLGDLKDGIAPDYSIVSSKALNAVNDSMNAVTNTVVVGYTDYTYSGDVDPTASYSITTAPNEGSFTYTLWNANTSAQLGTYTTNNIHATYIPFSVASGTIVAQCQEIRRNANGFAMYSDVQQLEQKIDNMDTSYLRVVGLTNKNQSVQYVYADASVTELQIQMPTSGMTKDWIVYVLATSNIVLKLPPANYWCTSEAATNEIPGPGATALYFSQVNDDTYCIGRQEFVPVTVQDQTTQLLQAVKKNARRFSSGNTTNSKLITK